MARRLLIVLVVAVAALIGGCRGDSGPTCCWTVDIAGRPWDLLLADRDGMRGMTSFQGADGMLFDFDADIDPAAVVFVMDGVAFPLDIAWFADSGELVGTASMAVCPAKPCPTFAAPGPYRWAVEAPPGAFDALPLDATLVIGGGT